MPANSESLPPMTPEEFAATVSAGPRELEQLKTYLATLEQWRARLNLVGPGSMSDPWRRHILDSAQLVPMLSPRGLVADVGSGAGLPGIVVAILSGRTVHLIESTGKKCTFLAEAKRATGAPVQIRHARAEELKGLRAATVMARAVAPLKDLLTIVTPLLAPGGVALFLKGKSAEEELTAAAKTWKYTATVSKSLSDQHGKVVKLERISRRHV